ncbi:Required for respiratory growth protein 9 mitochondrial [Elasticomyces elasticus]|nr:Required for respiratory growth protein 9 mitochondrial [Elasticomyces elasticus]KAK5025501.1 Required for respiratory growth protein 9 mitochondrial [Exophiala sideris]KAK5029774.1 Required for respiratory growth protein 9 mitochondrial [Exophiala sideris]KAK5178563.1 Required for respiratory growth protein 9 mitochondrial [Eurotiomycetes sp. CCFEE 6388]
MSMNGHSGRLVWDVVRSAKPSYNQSRLLNSYARTPLSSSFASLSLASQPTRTVISSACSKDQDIHLRKRRRYSSNAGIEAVNDRFDEIERRPARHGTGEDVRSFESTFKPTGPRGEGKARWNARERMSAKDNSRGAERQRSPSDVDISGVKNQRKKRVDLQDLAEPVKYKKSEPWQIQKQALEQKFGGDGWQPRKKLSPDTMEGIRTLHAEDPDRYSTPLLAEHFKVSPEAIRRILKSKWKPTEKELERRKQRWAKRHDRIWDQQAELGLRPKRAEDKPLEDPDEFEENLRAKEILDNARNA